MNKSFTMRLRCGGILNDRCIANFLEIVTVKEFFLNWPIFDEVMCRAFGVHFLAHSVASRIIYNTNFVH